ncbi:co-chaperone GroES [Fusibacter sp. JL216-2]|uniref:co-chaperone GroES n=1 Tax=Fusibacter sp. JL216-2 TaxID=3071453 RepID=UPI003D353E19
MAIKPLGQRVVIKKIEAEDKTASGIILPGQAQEQPQVAEVTAVGSAEDMTVKVGDRVIFPKYAGTEVKYGGEELIIIEEEKLLAIVE